MKKDTEIQKNVMDEIAQLPSIHSPSIGVAVKNGIVTLSGTVDSYPKKVAIERAALRVKDVIGIAEDIDVKLNSEYLRKDPELAQAVVHTLEWQSGLDPKKLKLHVEDGHVTINGTVDWDYQRKLAQRTVSNVTGVKKITNNIRIADRPLPKEIQHKIQAAFMRSASIDSRKIRVTLEGNKVTLSGKVRCYNEKKEAENSVWTMPGITDVDNQLEFECE